MKDDALLLCSLKIDYFFLYPEENKERIKLGLRIKYILTFKFLNFLECNNKLIFAIFGIKLGTCLAIFILIWKDFLGLRPKQKLAQRLSIRPEQWGLRLTILSPPQIAPVRFYYALRCPGLTRKRLLKHWLQAVILSTLNRLTK